MRKTTFFAGLIFWEALGFAGISETDFSRVINDFETRLGETAASFGAELSIDGRWHEERTFDGFGGPGGARICGNDDSWQICIAGGTARDNLVNETELVLILCHELGHYAMAGSADFETIEESSDYYAAESCFYQYYSQEPIRTEVSSNLPQQLESGCKDHPLPSICLKGIVTGLNLAKFSYQIWQEIAPGLEMEQPRFLEPDDRGPAQCRLNIYIAGFLKQPMPHCDWG